jgi:hypothetical protein
LRRFYESQIAALDEAIVDLTVQIRLRNIESLNQEDQDSAKSAFSEGSTSGKAQDSSFASEEAMESSLLC